MAQTLEFRGIMPNLAVSHLIALQGQDGGWGPYPGDPSRTEATALAALALQRAGEPAAGRAFDWLRAAQLDSGAWPIAPVLAEPGWVTSLAVFALSFDEPAGRSATNGARWLLAEEGSGATWWVNLLFRLFPQRKAVELDTDLTGWPWATGTFSWVEPTSYAMIALKRLRGHVRDARLEERLDEGDRLLVDRACVGGGWNYGNPRVLGEELWPYPDTTAAALLALADRGELPPVAAGLGVVPAMLEENESILALSLCGLAFGTHGVDRTGVIERLEGRIEEWSSGEVRALAWAALALDERSDVLGLSNG
ncbi:MAG: hypothetical protein OEU54_14890 [Gemmatimonadota bacterium]|nr:hypothetical protein [Gemmatimonadota bacterium]